MDFALNLSDWGYIGLFIATFLAGSILPFSSEIVLTAVLAAGLDPWICIFTATAGNWLGGITCYFIGRMGKMQWIEKYLRIKPEKLEKTQKFLQGKGALMAFFVFVPVVGDLIVVAFGLMRANMFLVFTAMLLGKFVRFVIWMEITMGVIKLL